jgi:hypothetical protein
MGVLGEMDETLDIMKMMVHFAKHNPEGYRFKCWENSASSASQSDTFGLIT